LSQLTIAEAARRAGVTRQTIYEWNRKGRLSINRDRVNKPYIDQAELHRCCGDTLKIVPIEPPSPEPQINGAGRDVELLEQQIGLLQQQLAELQRNNEWLKTQLAEVIRQPRGLLGWFRSR
jgi:excisionase family DNA binding protein